MGVQTAAEKKLLRVLHIGVANRGIWPLEKCTREIGFVPAALCDVNEAALQSARERTGLPASAVFNDVDRAFAEAQVDCAIICAPTVYHLPLCKKAIDAGLPVLVEKGMAPDWKSACELVNHAKQHQAIVAVAQNYRYCGAEGTLRRAINDSTWDAYVGPVHLLSYTQNRVRPLPRTLTFPFGSVWDMSCHHFDNMLHWLGRMKEMTAHSWKADWSAYAYDNNTAAHIVFESGTHVHYLHTHDAARTSLEIQIHGHRGAVFQCDSEITYSDRPLEQFGTRPIIPVVHEIGGGEVDVLRDFHAYICDGIEPGISAQNNLETMAACEMMVRSITQRRTVARNELT